MRGRNRRTTLAMSLILIVGIVSTALWLDNDRSTGTLLEHSYNFDSSKLESGFGAYNSTSETGVDSVSPSMVSQQDGHLVLRARGSIGSGVCLCSAKDKPTEPYGRWVIRARASAGDPDHGFAILLWPNAEDWPVGGEIDLLELPNGDRSRLQTSVHYSARNRQYTHFTPGDFSRWHNYGVTWAPTYIDFDLDGRRIFSVHAPDAIPHRPMHLAMQAGRNPSVKHPGMQQSTLLIDWVKTYALPST